MRNSSAGWVHIAAASISSQGPAGPAKYSAWPCPHKNTAINTIACMTPVSFPGRYSEGRSRAEEKGSHDFPSYFSERISSQTKIYSDWTMKPLIKNDGCDTCSRNTKQKCVVWFQVQVLNVSVKGTSRREFLTDHQSILLNSTVEQRLACASNGLTISAELRYTDVCSFMHDFADLLNQKSGTTRQILLTKSTIIPKLFIAVKTKVRGVHPHLLVSF